MIRAAALVLLALYPFAFAQNTSEQSPGEERATKQLKTIADAIKRCPEMSYPDEDGTEYVSAPLNTVWDVVQRQSARSGKIGYIEYILHSRYSPKPLPDCKKRDTRCQSKREVTRQVVAILEQGGGPDHYRYEFDLGPDGLEFARALAKRESEDDTHWRASSLGGCAGGVVSATLNAHSL